MKGMNPFFRAIIYICFILPAVMLDALWQLLTKGMTRVEKIKWLWRIPYVLIIILIIIMIALWNKGYR